MEQLIEDGAFRAVLDMTTTELADEVVGGVMSAGPHRLEAAGRKGIPQLVCPGAIDMVNFGPEETVPATVPEPQPVPPQPQRHSDADDAGRVCGDRTHHSHQAQPRKRTSDRADSSTRRFRHGQAQGRRSIRKRRSTPIVAP